MFHAIHIVLPHVAPLSPTGHVQVQGRRRNVLGLSVWRRYGHGAMEGDTEEHARARGVEDGLGIALVSPRVVGGAKEASGARGGVAPG